LSVEEFQQNFYGIVIIDGSDNIHTIGLEMINKTYWTQEFEHLTQSIEKDLPLGPLKITGVQSTSKNTAELTINYLLLVNSFHSYQIQIRFLQDKTIKLEKILACLVQIPGYSSIGSGLFTDNFFFDLKQKTDTGFYYLFSYPLDSFFSMKGESNPGNYSYIKPIQKQFIEKNDNLNNLQIYALNGEATKVFIGVSKKITKKEEIQQVSDSQSEIINGYNRNIAENSLNLEIQIFNASKVLELGFNPDLGMTTLMIIEANHVTIETMNDFSATKLEVLLDKPIDILNSAYFIIFTVIFSLIFCLTCAWFFRRAYRKRRLSYDEKDEESYKAVTDDYKSKRTDQFDE